MPSNESIHPDPDNHKHPCTYCGNSFLCSAPVGMCIMDAATAGFFWGVNQNQPPPISRCQSCSPKLEASFAVFYPFPPTWARTRLLLQQGFCNQCNLWGKWAAYPPGTKPAGNVPCFHCSGGQLPPLEEMIKSTGVPKKKEKKKEKCGCNACSGHTN